MNSLLPARRQSALAGALLRGYPARRMKSSAVLLFILCLSMSMYAGAENSELPAGKFHVGSLEFTRPEAWKSIQPTSPMRKAQLQVPGKDGGKPADVTFFFFGEGNGGGVEPNVQRWLGQFESKPGASKVEPLEFNGVKVTLVSTEGTMKASPMAGIAEAMADAALLGAIIENPNGAVFVKMTGPAALVKENREAFLALAKSATDKK